jgi:hypothetical protein
VFNITLDESQRRSGRGWTYSSLALDGCLITTHHFRLKHSVHTDSVTSIPSEGTARDAKDGFAFFILTYATHCS